MSTDDDTPTELHLCTDCLMVLGRGAETPDEHAAAEAMARVWGPDYLLSVDTDDTDEWLSPSPCDGCERPTGGIRETRHTGHAVRAPGVTRVTDSDPCEINVYADITCASVPTHGIWVYRTYSDRPGWYLIDKVCQRHAVRTVSEKRDRYAMFRLPPPEMEIRPL